MSEHKFRYLLSPGTNFQFVSRFKIVMTVSIFLMLASVGALFFNKATRGSYMNWTIDFKGGTEMIFAFRDKASGAYTQADPGQVRQALGQAGEQGIDVSEMTWAEYGPQDQEIAVRGIIVRTPRFSALTPEMAQQVSEAFMAKFADRQIGKATWSGDRLSVRSQKPISNAEAAEFFATVEHDGPQLEVKPWLPEEAALYTQPDQGTGEYNQWYAIWGLDRQYEHIFEKVMPEADAIVKQSYGVGAKAGDKLRDDAIKAIVYAIFLIMLYLAFRFDIRYAPGAAFATIHDAVMVIGVFAITWTEVSLTSVAGLLTVMGFSVNDTVIVFDRIRENQAKLKDKKLDRIVDISINEMLSRSLLTSVTVLAVTLIMNIFGTGLVRNFAFAMNVGVVVGVYSSLYLAVPVFLWISRKWYSGPPVRRRAAPVPTAAPAAASADPTE